MATAKGGNFSLSGHEGHDCVKFEDTCGDEYVVRQSTVDEDIAIEAADGCLFYLDKGRARVLSRILAFYAEDGDLSRAQEAIDGTTADGTVAAMQDRIDEVEQRVADIEEKFVACQIVTRLKAVEEKVSAFSGQLGDVREWCSKLQGSFDARGDRIDAHWRLIQRSKERLDALEERTKPQATAPCRTKTPQEIADQMSERFPVGTKVLGWISPEPNSVPFGMDIAGRFFVDPSGRILVDATYGGFTYLAVRVKPFAE